MSARNLTWQQVVVCFGLLGAVVGAYKLFGELPAGVLLVLTGIVNLLLGRQPPPPGASGSPDDSGKQRTANGRGFMRVLIAALACVACGQPASTDLERLTTTLSRCRGEGRDAGSYTAYERCKEREGVNDAGAGGR